MYRHYQNNKILSLLLSVVLLSMTACVTTIEGGDSREGNPRKALESHIRLGLGYLRINNRDSARHHFQKALEYDSRSAGAHDGMALLYQMEGENELAEEHFQRAIRYNGKFARALNNYGNFLYEQERFEEALEQFEAASRILDYSRRPITLVNLGRTAQKLGNQERAESAYRQALGLDPALTPAMAELAEIAFNDQEYAEAKRLIDQYGRLTTHSARTLWLGIRLERIFGNTDKEASYALQLRNLHPYSKEYLQYKQTSEGDDS